MKKPKSVKSNLSRPIKCTKSNTTPNPIDTYHSIDVIFKRMDTINYGKNGQRQTGKKTSIRPRGKSVGPEIFQVISENKVVSENTESLVGKDLAVHATSFPGV